MKILDGIKKFFSAEFEKDKNAENSIALINAGDPFMTLTTALISQHEVIHSSDEKINSSTFDEKLPVDK